MAALQCGICTPGLLVASKALLRRNPNPTETEVRYWLAGNLCRCTGYDKIVRAVLDAAAEMRGGSTMNVVTDNKWIGKRTIRPDGVDKVTGRAAFAADTTMPGMIWGKVLRSPHAHARIKSIDTSKAEALPGVKAVVTAKDIVDFPIDKSGDARHPGHALDVPQRHGAREGAVPRPCGRRRRRITEAIAAKACELIEVDYEVLPYVDRHRRRDEAGRADPARASCKFDGKPSNIAGKLERQAGRRRRRLQAKPM